MQHIFILKKLVREEGTQTVSLNDSVNINLDSEGKTLGIEILDASKNFPKNAINSAIAD